MIDYFRLAKEIWDIYPEHERTQEIVRNDRSENPWTYCQYEPIGPLALDIYYRALDITYIGFVFCQLALQNMFRSIYTGYTKQQMYFYTVENFLDNSIFLVFLTFITLTYRIDLEGTWFRSYTD